MSIGRRIEISFCNDRRNTTLTLWKKNI